MKKLVIGTLVLMSISAHAQVKKPATPAKPAAKPATATTAPLLKNRTDSVSYAIGILDGSFFKNQGLDKVNGVVLGRAFQDALSGKPLMTPEECNDLLRVEMERMKTSKVQPTIDEGKKFLAENRKKAGVKETATGLQYEVITMGTGPRPVDTSNVKVHYHGTLLNGKVFDSSRDRGEPITFNLQQVIAGWIEGLQLMPQGSRFKFYVPYNLGYGLQGSGPIPGGAVLVFDIELLDIIKEQQ
jgi:FKBP-type peptidyl-prolyl cis-trans isomerase